MTCGRVLQYDVMKPDETAPDKCCRRVDSAAGRVLDGLDVTGLLIPPTNYRPFAAIKAQKGKTTSVN